MTQEDKQLLLVDLCARLPYGVKVMKQYKSQTRTLMSVDVVNCRVHFIENDINSPFGFNIEEPCHFYQQIKPYLRPMSSMTEEEMIDFLQVPDLSKVSKKFIYDFRSGNFGMMTNMSNYARNIDWLNARHFDYRGLIDKGLAISTKEFNPYKD